MVIVYAIGMIIWGLIGSSPIKDRKGSWASGESKAETVPFHARSRTQAIILIEPTSYELGHLTKNFDGSPFERSSTTSVQHARGP